jgi:hypothetical protein
MRLISWLLCLAGLLLLLGGAVGCDEEGSTPPINPDGVVLDGAHDGGAAQPDQGGGG